jgi:hypothetical protein
VDGNDKPGTVRFGTAYVTLKSTLVLSAALADAMEP